jgi:hypothetical protein
MEHFKATRIIKLKDEDMETLASCLELLYALDEELAEFLDEQEDSAIRLLKDEAWKSYATLYDFLKDCKHFEKEVK